MVEHGNLPPGQQRSDFLDALRGVLSPEALTAIETWAQESLVDGDRAALGLPRRLSALEEAFEKSLPRVRALENQTPNNSYRRKVKDGHHHEMSVEGMDDAVSQGFGYQLNATSGIKLTRASWPNNLRLDIANAGIGPFEFDHLVDADFAAVVSAGDGTEGMTVTTLHGHTFKVWSVIQSAVDGWVTAGGDQSILIVPGDYTGEDVTVESHLIGGVNRITITTPPGDMTFVGSLTLSGPLGNVFNGYPESRIENLKLTNNLILSSDNDRDVRSVQFVNLNVGGSLQFKSDTIIVVADYLSFELCRFAGGVDDNGLAVVLGSTRFNRCAWGGKFSFFAKQGSSKSRFANGVTFTDCLFLNSIQVGSMSSYVHFVGCQIDGDSSSVAAFALGSTGSLGSSDMDYLLFSGCWFGYDDHSAEWAFIKIGSVNGVQALFLNLAITGCTVDVPNLPADSEAPIHFLWAPDDLSHSSSYVHVAFVGNSLIEDSSGNRMEDLPTTSRSYTVKGYFERSVFGPNCPADFEVEILGGTKNLYVGTGDVIGDGIVSVAPGDKLNLLYDNGSLSVGWNAFITREDNVINNISASTLNVADDDTSYVEVLGSSVSSNTTGYTLGSIPLGVVVASSGDIDSITEETAVLGNDEIFKDFFNGTFLETLDADITEAGGVVTLSLQQEGGGDLTMRFSSGLTTLSTPKTIALTLGDDDSPQANYIYILESDQTQLTKSTSQWPATEHIKVGYYLVPSAAFVAAGGGARCYIQQQWNDHRMGTDNMGHLAHMAERERLTSARYFSGINSAGTTSYLTIVGATVDYKATSGVIFQMHRHTSAAVDTSGGDEVLVVNWPDIEGAYHNITNLFDIVEDSGGNPIGNNKWFNLVIWGVANKTGTYEPAMINLPSGFYNTQASAEQDISGFDNFDLPREFDLESSTAFLIARLTVQKQAGTWAFGSVVDLRRGDLLGARGGASSPETEFADSTFNIFDATTNTKVGNFQLDQVAADNTRTLTWPNASGVIALTSQSDGTIDHGADLAGLGDSDHAAHLDVDGSKPLTGDWEPGNARIIGNHIHTEKVLSLTVGDAAYGLLLVGGAPTIIFDTDGGELDFLVYDRGANEYVLTKNSIAILVVGDGYLEIPNQGELRFHDNGNYVGFKAPALGANKIWVLPDADGNANEALVTDASGNLSFSASHGVTHNAVHGIAKHTEFNNWKVFHSDGSGDQQEVALSAAGGILESKGAATPPVFTIPKRSIIIRAATLTPNTTDPCADAEQSETGTGGKNYITRAFAANEQGSMEMFLPENYDGGTVTWWYAWISPTGSSAGDTVIFGLRGSSTQNGDLIGEAQGGQVTITDTLLTGVGRYHKADESGALTIAGSPAGGDLVIWEIERTGGTMSEEAPLLTIYIRYGTNNASDE
jgi:hypothetical protein